MAVYTEVSDDVLAAFLDNYDIGRATALKGIAEGVENSNFLLQTEQDSYILTLYEKRVRESDLPFFLSLMDHLASRGFSCPTPVHGHDGKALRSLAGRPAAIATFLPGVSPRAIAVRHCAEVGAAVAKLHLASTDFKAQRANDLSVDGWRALANACSARADTVRPGLAMMIRDELEWLSEHWPDGLPAGVIHADLFPDNVFFLDRQVSGVIDFYFACTDFLAYDLAICINAWCFDTNHKFVPERSRQLMQAYDALRPLTAEEIAVIPILARGSALRFLLTRLFDWLNRAPSAFVQPKNPLDYVARLGFHQTVTGPDVYRL
jgi:homoserine kinase type II